MRNSAAVPVALGLGFLTVGAVFVYLRLKKRRSSDPSPGVSPSKQAGEAIIEFPLPNNVIPFVVGKNEEIIQNIEQMTGAKICFKELDSLSQICKIRGDAEAVEKAELMVKMRAVNPPTSTETMEVPVAARGKILGRCGEMLEEIQEKSGAKIWIESGPNDLTEIVQMTGTQAQINAARQLVKEKVSLVRVTQTPEPREVLPPKVETLDVDKSAKEIEIYVSAVVSPSKFYIQILGSQTSELDLLVDAMTEYYSSEENQARHVITKPQLGQLVAAKFEGDDRWYRAEVLTYEPNHQNEMYDLFFPDYGDNLYVYPQDIFELKNDFLGLKYQAIECFLAFVKPINPENKNQWSRKANDRFDNLVHVAKWKKLKAKTVTFRQDQERQIQIPGLEVYDEVNGERIDVAETLISEGLALRSTTGYFGDLLKSSVLKIDDKKDFPPINGSSQAPKEVAPEPLALNIKEVTEKTLKEESGINNNLNGTSASLRPTITTTSNNNATVDFLANERQEGAEKITDEEVVRQTLYESEAAVKQWSDLLKPDENAN